MQYLRKSFTVPAGSQKCSDEDWEAIFGTEEERKAKMKAAIEAQNAAKGSSKPVKCGGGVGSGRVLSSIPESMYQGLEENCKRHGIKDTASARKAMESHAASFGAEHEKMERAARDNTPPPKEE